MTKLFAFFRLIRWINLVFIALTQVMLQYLYLRPILSNPFISIDPTLSHSNFFLLVFATLLIAAAGYMINDYFDVKADEVNKPHRIFVDRVFSRRAIITWHLILNTIGIGLGFYVANQIGNSIWGFLFVGTMAILWFYSTRFKKQALIGNLLISLLTGLVVMMVFWFEPKLSAELNDRMPALYRDLRLFFWGYAGFAFLVTMVRELVKDMEDMLGDQQDGALTLPLLWGVKRTKGLVFGLITLVLILLGIFQAQEALHYQQKMPFYSVPSIRLIFTFLQIPLVYLIIKLLKADRPADFRAVSNLTKFIMLVGILFLFYFYALNGNPAEDWNKLFK